MQMFHGKRFCTSPLWQVRLRKNNHATSNLFQCNAQSEFIHMWILCPYRLYSTSRLIRVRSELLAFSYRTYIVVTAVCLGMSELRSTTNKTCWSWVQQQNKHNKKYNNTPMWTLVPRSYPSCRRPRMSIIPFSCSMTLWIWGNPEVCSDIWKQN